MSANENQIAEAVAALSSLWDGGAVSAGTSDLLMSQLHSGYNLLFSVW